MANTSVKQQVVDTLQEVEAILITVGKNPSVDVLSAALGLTLLLNKVNKHATAVFSGDIPPAISFLDPEKTFENTVDSLRDFIIALDKEKADHLRYKVDGDMVKIFITPYRTTITEEDLDYSSGDYNVEAVIAIDVKNEEDLDKALSDHGRIMHDATVASLSVGKESSTLGSLQWHEEEASSYSEMVTELAEGLRDGRSLLDEQTATALLTGIVAATERFSNEKTSSTSMTAAAQLMAAGANQQLIAVRLEEAEEIEHADTREKQNPPKTENEALAATLLDVPEDKNDESASKPKTSKKSKAEKTPQEPILDRPAPDGTMVISHEKRGDVDEVRRQVEEEGNERAREEAEKELGEIVDKSSSAPVDLKSLESDLARESNGVDELDGLPDLSKLPPVEPPKATNVHDEREEMDEPTFGAALSATSEQAAKDARAAEEADKNKKILKHDGAKYVTDPPANIPGLNSFTQPSVNPEMDSVDPLSSTSPTASASSLPELPTLDQQVPSVGSGSSMPAEDFSMQFEASPTPAPQALAAEEIPTPSQTLNEIDEQFRQPPLEQSAQDAVNAALESATPASEHASSALPDVPSLPPMQSQFDAVPDASNSNFQPMPPMPPMPSTTSLPPLGNDLPSPASPTNTTLGSLPPLPPLPEQPIASPAPQNPEQLLGSILPPAPQSAPSQTAPQPLDPNQFNIPTQQP